MRKHVEKEAPQKLLSRYRHEPLLIVMRIVLPSKGDLTVSKTHQPVIGDSDAMRVASQIMQHVLWTTKRRLSIHHQSLRNNERRKERKVDSCASG